MKIILGALIIAAGTAIILKSDYITNNVGRVYTFEKYLGAEGGTRLGYKLVGVIIIAIGIMIMTGMIGNFLNWFLGPLIKFAN